MKTKLFATVAALAVLGTAPAFAAEDCDGGFKTHLNNMTVYFPKVSGGDLASAVQKSLDAYKSCKAGDNFSPHGVWDQIMTDMAAKAKG